MDDTAKSVTSYQIDQEILDARGIDITVEEVAGLSTTKYSERVHTMRLNKEDMAFLKGLRRRIKNRQASQNSRRRSMEQLRRLTKELRAVRAYKCNALVERATLMRQRAALIDRCRSIHRHVEKILTDRRDSTPLPDLQVVMMSEASIAQYEAQEIEQIKIEADIEESVASSEETESEDLTPQTTPSTRKEPTIDRQAAAILNCRIDKLEPETVVYDVRLKEQEQRVVTAKTVFLPNDTSNAVDKNIGNGYKEEFTEECCVLNLSLKENGRRSHGRKQSAPRRIAYVDTQDFSDSVLDLKINKDSQ